MAKYRNLVRSALVTLLVWTSVLGFVCPQQRLAETMWGGDHIRIEVEGDSALVDYDCANGSIKGPLILKPNGRFSWEGVHTREHSGPIRRDEKPDNREAVYYGSVRNDIMTLTVKLKSSNAIVGTFILKRDTPGRVFKCR